MPAHAAASQPCFPNGIQFIAPDAEIEAGRDIGCNNKIEVVNNFHSISGVSGYESPTNVGVAEVIAWLTDYSVNYFPAHEKVCSQRGADTGRSFSKTLAYKMWTVLGLGKYRNLECVGIPGAGKTTMASMVIEDLQDGYLVKWASGIVLYAYFRHDTQATQTIPIVLASLIVQVIKQTGKVSSDIQKLYRDYHDPSNNRMAPAVNMMVKILQRELSKFLRAYIVVDALDEYSLPNYSPSHALVVQLQHLNARLLITSRYAVGFSPNTFSTLKVSAHIDDIRIVLRAHLTGHLATIVYDTPGLLEEILSEIVTKSAGMFIVAKLLINYIPNSRSLTANDLRAAVKELPTGTDETYHLAMTRIQEQESHVAELGTQALYWVYFSKRQLTVMELRHTLSFQRSKIISKDDLIGEDRIQSACAGLISFVKLKDKQKTVKCQFSHFTTREFLDKFWRKYLPDGERQIRETCLRYLPAAVFGFPLDITEDTVWHENLQRYCLHQGLSLSNYAVEYPEHLAPDTAQSILHDMICKVVRNHLTGHFATALTRTPGLLEELARALIMKSAGTFEVATLLVNFIPRSRPLTAEELRAAVKDLPSGVRPEEMYDGMIKRIQNQKPYLAGVGMDALTWVYLSKRRLTVTELHHALSFRRFNDTISKACLIGEDQIVTACAGLITLENNKGAVECKFTHFTTREFLDKSWQSYLPDGERQITETCLAYLAAAVSGVPLRVTEAARRDPFHNVVWRKYCGDHGFALCTYALEYWSDHARAIDEAFDLDTGGSFFKHRISPYTEDENATCVYPDDLLGPDKYWILYFARFGLLHLLQKHAQRYRSSQKESVNYKDVRDRYGRTALHLSALGCHTKIVEYLLNNGVDVNLLDSGRYSPLHLGVQAGSSSVATAQLLLDRGAVGDQPNHLGRAPISYAIQPWPSFEFDTSPDIIRLLLQHEVDVYRLDRDGNSPLSLAQKSRNLEIKQLLEGYAPPPPPKPRTYEDSRSPEEYFDFLELAITVSAD